MKDVPVYNNIKANNNDVFDYYRGISSFIVFLNHFWQILITPVIGVTWVAVFISCAARYSVLIFFLLSGYLISLSIDVTVRKFGYFKLSEYLINRISRIYPPLILSIIICLSIFLVITHLHMHGSVSYMLLSDKGPVARDVFKLTSSEIFGTLLQLYAVNGSSYININGPLWSLSYEIMCYCLIALIFSIKQIVSYYSKINKYVLITLILSLISIYFIRVNKFWFPFYFSIWCFGFIVHRKSNILGKNYYVYSSILFILSILIVYFLFGWSPFTYIEAMPNALVQLPFSFLLLNGIIYSGYVKTKIPAYSFFKGMSKYSYTLYICHFPILLFWFSCIHKIFAKNNIAYYTLAFLCSMITVVFCKIMAIFWEDKKWFRINIIEFFGFVQGFARKRRTTFK